MRFREQLRTFVREPLLHFLVLGGVLYGLYGLFGPAAAPEPQGDDERRITVTAGDIDWMVGSWEKRWMRPPTEQELAGLIDQHVRETVLYREALSMGLDEDDVIIRRRLAQKLEFLSQDLVDSVPPTEDELRAFFDEHAERYRAPGLITFATVFVDPDLHEDDTLPHAERVGAKLRALAPPTEGFEALGDPFMLQSYYPEHSEAQIAKLFGSPFAGSVAELEAGAWHGPILSGYGVHFVYVEARTEPPPPTFEMAGDDVIRDFEDSRREAFDADFYQSLQARYEVVIEQDEPADEFAAMVGQAR